MAAETTGRAPDAPQEVERAGMGDEPPLPTLGTAGLLRWMWRQLTSMRTALVLLFLLAIASVPGSLLPQRGANPERVERWITENPTLGPVLDRLGFFDVFAAPWFAAETASSAVSTVAAEPTPRSDRSCCRASA